MGFWDSGGDAPTPPNPIATAAAQTGTNVSTAIANSYLGNMNQITPQGSLSFDKFADFTYTDPTTNQTFNIPRWQATQSFFNPQQYLNQNPDVMNWARNSGMSLDDAAKFHYQKYGQYEPQRPAGYAQDAFTAGQQAQLNMAQMGRQQSEALKNLLSTNFNPTATAPGAAPMDWLHAQLSAQPFAPDTPDYQFGYNTGGNIQDAYNLGGDITRSYGPNDNFSADRQRIESGLMQRLDPQLQLEKQRVQQQLSDQGIRQGYSGGGGWEGRDAYTNAMDVYNRQANDARLAVIGQGGQEQQRLSQMAQAQAAFQNAAQAQNNQQLAALAQFGNQAQAQRTGQNAAQAAFYNQAAGSTYAEQASRLQAYNAAVAQRYAQAQGTFAAQNQMRNQYLGEQYQQRAQPINEIAALLSGGQVSQPSFINAARNTIPTTDVAGLINQNFAQQNDLFKTSQQSWNDIMGGILGFGGQVARAGIPMMSDRREKENIEPMGSVLGNGKKLPIYEYSYKADPDETRHVGPMAQDVEKLDPRAVTEIGGVKHIRPDRLGSIFGRG